MTHLLVTGASGLLGLNLSLYAHNLGYVVDGWTNDTRLPNAPFTVRQVNLLDLDEIQTQVDKVNPDVIIHCAALANLDRAEAEPDLAFRLNADVPGEIAKIADVKGIPLVHISTDSVFDGKTGDYCENDTVSPVGIYTQSKVEGEKAVQKFNADAIIARVNFYGWSLSGKRSLAEYFYTNLSENKPINGFTDVIFCPLYVRDLVNILLEMVKKDLKGIYHVLSSEKLSKYAFGVAIAHKFGLDQTLITPISVKDATLKAVRSPNMTLRVDKLTADLGHTLPNVNDGLCAFYRDLIANVPRQLRECL